MTLKYLFSGISVTTKSKKEEEGEKLNTDPRFIFKENANTRCVEAISFIFQPTISISTFTKYILFV